MTVIKYLFLLTFNLIGCLNGNENMIKKELAGKQVYFESFATTNKGLPYYPINQVSQQEAENRFSYLKAEYDIAGKLVSLEKIVDGNQYFLQEITYFPNDNVKTLP